MQIERYKTKPRSEEDIKKLKQRLNRVIGQLNGISKMVDDNRYCGDILNQIGAATNALNQIGYIILQSHIDTCVRKDMINNKEGVAEETIKLMKNLK